MGEGNENNDDRKWQIFFRNTSMPSQYLPCTSINKDIIHFILLPILQGWWFSSVLRFPPPITLTATEILLKMALSTKKPNQTKPNLAMYLIFYIIQLIFCIYIVFFSGDDLLNYDTIFIIFTLVIQFLITQILLVK